MSRTSPPTERVVAVLEFLSRHERERFGISELARRVGLSKPTCLGIAATLVESGYLIRDDRDKTYRLGPALIPLGRAARTSLRADPAGGDILAGLWEAFGHPVSLSGVVGDRVTVLDVAVDPGRPAMVKVGDSYPFTPRSGSCTCSGTAPGGSSAGSHATGSAPTGTGSRGSSRPAAPTATSSNS
ncbi:hypothetical protein MTP03_40480 [Tsukamurella sp. PLM1]|nr:hypothetical protein MTP03_40480 [Tsukamurella sp. PLM1]